MYIMEDPSSFNGELVVKVAARRGVWLWDFVAECFCSVSHTKVANEVIVYGIDQLALF